MQTDDYDYQLPDAAIGQTPAEPRDSARLLDARDPAAIAHHTVGDLPSLLEAGDLLVVNDTRVLPARFHLHKPTGGAVEVLLLEPTGEHHRWRALVKPGKRLRVGTVLELDGIPAIAVIDVLDDGRRVVELLADDLLEAAGEVPLPPYIHAPLADPERYQTIYAQDPGSVAAPTAGLHLTDRVLADLDAKGVGLERVELRVGLGTFRPISTDRVEDHHMHTERYRVRPEAWDRIQATRAAGGRIVAVGTTTVRTLESAAASGELEGDTELFIHRGFEWKVVDVLMTNFHVPRSSLLVMIDAFVGDSPAAGDSPASGDGAEGPAWRNIYATALAEGYRFLSFGDAMLLARPGARSG